MRYFKEEQFKKDIIVSSHLSLSLDVSDPLKERGVDRLH